MKINRIDIKGEVYDIEAYKNPIPTGSVIPFAGETPPEGFLLCNGQEVSRVTYSRLFNVIKEKFGAGDGVTTFQVPNLVEKFIEGTESSVGQTLNAGLPNITAGFAAYTYQNGSPSGKMKGTITNTNQVGTGGGSDRTFVQFSLDASRNSDVYGKSNTVQPPAVKMLLIIKD